MMKRVSEAVKVDRLPLKVEMFRTVAKTVGTTARWFEGCECHKDIWTQRYSSRKRKWETFAQACPGQSDCIWKGKKSNRYGAWRDVGH